MINITPNPIAFSIPLPNGTVIPIHWYGIAYVVAILGGGWMATVLAKRRGENVDVIPNGLILIAAAALVGGRLYHVIDQWAYYRDHLAQIVLPPYSGLGIYGGLATGLVAVLWYVRRYHLNFWRWADIIAPAILTVQVIGRWGNFANQELYGPPTNLPWGIAIQCQYRVPEYACGIVPADAHFHPLFLYESLMSLAGIVVLIWLWRRFIGRGLIAGDVGMLYFVWYGTERFLLEFFRHGYNWTFFGVPMAQIVGIGAASAAIAVILFRHWWARRTGYVETQAGEPVDREADAAQGAERPEEQGREHPSPGQAG